MDWELQKIGDVPMDWELQKIGDVPTDWELQETYLASIWELRRNKYILDS